MTAPDNSRFLAKAAAQRRDATRHRAKAAIESLDSAGQPITFCLVAETAGVSRAWLYRETDIRQAIISLRANRPRVSPARPAAQQASTASLRQRLDGARAEIADLRAENAALRHQLARQLGEHRAQHEPEPLPR